MSLACLYFLICWGIDLPRRVPEYPRWVGLGLRVEGPAQNGEVRVRRASTLGRVIGWRKCPETKSPELPHPAACFSFTPACCRPPECCPAPSPHPTSAPSLQDHTANSNLRCAGRLPREGSPEPTGETRNLYGVQRAWRRKLKRWATG